MQRQPPCLCCIAGMEPGAGVVGTEPGAGVAAGEMNSGLG